MTDERKLSRESIFKHITVERLLTIIHGKVYDVTPFLKDHPGGVDVLLGVAGQDGSEAFDDMGHSDEVKRLRENYLIGQVETKLTLLQQSDERRDIRRVRKKGRAICC